MKDELRKYYLDIRKNIKNKTILDKKIYVKVINNKKIKNNNLILIYVSFNNEVDTIELIKYFLNNKLVAVPKIENNRMNFYYINKLSDLKKGSFNILEPITNNIVKDYANCVSITPGICFSRNLNRIGYGKGYYDKFYSEHKEIYKLGLSYDECITDNFDIDIYDQKLDEIITPTQNYKNDI